MKNAAGTAAFFYLDKLVLVFALLICNAAAGLASRLAGGLALAASAILRACAKILCLDSLNMLHKIPPNFIYS